MERSSQEVRNPNPGVRRLISRATFLCRLVLVCGTFHAVSHSQSADFLIVERPESLTVYDAFQKSLAGESTETLTFVPLKILSSRELLSDGLTAAMKIEVEGNIFYLLYDEKKKLAGSSRAGIMRTFRNKQSLRDSVEILQTIRFESPDRKQKDFLTPADVCIRYFRDGGMLYFKRLGKKPVFGWALLSRDQEGITWKIVRSSTQRGLSLATVSRMTERVREANQALSKIYSMLNQETGKKAAPPFWRIDSMGDFMSFVFEPVQAAKSYQQSMKTLSATLQTYLLGSDFDAVLVGGNRIEVRQHKASDEKRLK